MSSSPFSKTHAPRSISVPFIWTVDGFGGFDLVCFLDFGEQLSVCAGLEEVVLVEQLAGGVGKLKESVGKPPFEPLAVPFDDLDQSHLLQPDEVVGECRRCDARIVVFEFFLRGRPFRMTDDRPDDIRAGRVVEGTQRCDRIEAGRVLGWRERGGVRPGHYVWVFVPRPDNHFGELRSGSQSAWVFHFRSYFRTVRWRW